MQVDKQIKVYEDGYKGPKVLTQAQQNKQLAMRPTLAHGAPVKDSQLMYEADDEHQLGDNNSDELVDDADDEITISEIVQYVKKKPQGQKSKHHKRISSIIAFATSQIILGCSIDTIFVAYTISPHGRPIPTFANSVAKPIASFQPTGGGFAKVGGPCLFNNYML
ncbi:MAG: hypothetical protein EZS28_026651 [Streblomastix strix]|uniref:Uncharacterized protein n=1 Tax=Streblomastix strix TaxID=222440 RepID=A0A5J4V608_9EUKA|nr:MAG: hypothetical protein EZS28_026651 [Streblomastix strix]